MNIRNKNPKIGVLDVPDVLECTYVMYKNFLELSPVFGFLAVVRMYLRKVSKYIQVHRPPPSLPQTEGAFRGGVKRGELWA
jgi:hypothetical protein